MFKRYLDALHSILMNNHKYFFRYSDVALDIMRMQFTHAYVDHKTKLSPSLHSFFSKHTQFLLKKLMYSHRKVTRDLGYDKSSIMMTSKLIFIVSRFNVDSKTHNYT